VTLAPQLGGGMGIADSLTLVGPATFILSGLHGRSEPFDLISVIGMYESFNEEMFDELDQMYVLY
jgi:hypothetical protein